MFWSPLRLGGEPRWIGDASAFFASRIAYLRAKRAMVSQTFNYLALPLHAAMVGLLEFIVVIMTLFSASIKASADALPEGGDVPASISTGQILTFGQVNILLVDTLVTSVVLVLTVANAYAPKAAEGGHNLKLTHNLSITMLITGFMMLAVPVAARAIFSSIVET